jgi:hypothetical protein
MKRSPLRNVPDGRNRQPPGTPWYWPTGQGIGRITDVRMITRRALPLGVADRSNAPKSVQCSHHRSHSNENAAHEAAWFSNNRLI